MGIKTISVSSSNEKLDTCKNLGSDFTINYKEVSKE
jgi:NADPH-dependent curcumin reductase CurA